MMGIKVSWDEERGEKSMILMVYERPWNWIDFDNAAVKLDHMLKSVDHTVDFIIDIRKGGFPPTGAIQRFKKVTDAQHTNMGMIAYVGLADFIRNTLEILSRAYHGSYHSPRHLFASTVEQARDALTMRHAHTSR